MALSDIMNAFSRNAPTTGAPATQPTGQQTPPTPGQIPAGVNPSAQPPQGSTVPVVGAAPASTEPASPLDQFSQLWDNDPNSPAKTDLTTYGGVKPEDIMASASKIDFAKVVKPEVLQAIQAGGEGAVAALAQALNATSQAVFANSSIAATKLIDKALGDSQSKLDSMIDAKFRQLNFSNNLRETNPILNHPAAAPMVAMLETQFATKYPNASTAELTKMAQEYFTQTFTALAAKPETTSATTTAPETDWMEFGQGKSLFG